MAAESLKEDDGATLVYAIGSFRFRRFGRETPLAQSTANGYIQVAYQPFGLNSRRPLQRSPFVFFGTTKKPRTLSGLGSRVLDRCAGHVPISYGYRGSGGSVRTYSS